MKCDFHVHSHYSGDSEATIDEMCRGAIKNGVDAICFTDHHDLNRFSAAMQAQIDEHMPGYAAFLIEQPGQMVLEITAAREKFPQLKILLGIELGASSDMDFGGLDILDKLPLDYLLMSCHDMGGVDPYFPTVLESTTRENAICDYYKAIYDGMKCVEKFDGMAHIGYPYRYMLRYGVYGENERGYLKSDCPDLVDAILKHVINIGAVLELNMSGFSEGYTMPHLDILRRYVQLGGNAALFASDAHEPRKIGQHYCDAVEIMKTAGIKYLASYEKRVQTLTKI